MHTPLRPGQEGLLVVEFCGVKPPVVIAAGDYADEKRLREFARDNAERRGLPTLVAKAAHWAWTEKG